MASKHTLSLRGDTFEAIGSYLFSDNSVERAGYLSAGSVEQTMRPE